MRKALHPSPHNCELNNPSLKEKGLRTLWKKGENAGKHEFFAKINLLICYFHFLEHCEHFTTHTHTKKNIAQINSLPHNPDF